MSAPLRLFATNCQFLWRRGDPYEFHQNDDGSADVPLQDYLVIPREFVTADEFNAIIARWTATNPAGDEE